MRELEDVLVVSKPAATLESSVGWMQIHGKQAGSGSKGLRRHILPHMSIRLVRKMSLCILRIKSKLKLANYFFSDWSEEVNN